MKFKDIPQYTRLNGYQVNVGLKHIDQTIREWEEETRLEMNPDFQRGHVWTEQQQIKFIEFLLRGGISGRVCYFNHPNWHTNLQGWFVCVDGLQRITAVRRFMNNEIPVFEGHYYKDFEDRIPIDLNLVFVVNDLQTRREVLAWYLELNDTGVAHEQSELDRVRALLVAEHN